MPADRHFVEWAFEDAESTCGIADYQLRGWQVLWHKLPDQVKTDDGLIAMIEDHHQRHLKAKQSAYQKQAESLVTSC